MSWKNPPKFSHTYRIMLEFFLGFQVCHSHSLKDGKMKTYGFVLLSIPTPIWLPSLLLGLFYVVDETRAVDGQAPYFSKPGDSPGTCNTCLADKHMHFLLVCVCVCVCGYGCRLLLWMYVYVGCVCLCVYVCMLWVTSCVRMCVYVGQ